METIRDTCAGAGGDKKKQMALLGLGEGFGGRTSIEKLTTSTAASGWWVVA